MMVVDADGTTTVVQFFGNLETSARFLFELWMPTVQGARMANATLSGGGVRSASGSPGYALRRSVVGRGCRRQLGPLRSVTQSRRHEPVPPAGSETNVSVSEEGYAP
jgi:hypothetical protein